MNAFHDFIQSRRSIRRYQPQPIPDEIIRQILSAAVWSPSAHNRQPWRFVVITGEARQRITEQLAAIAFAREPDMPEEMREKEMTRLTRAPVAIVVISGAKEHVKIPEWEQILSAGAVCLNLFMAANALGFGANWLTEWYSYDEEAMQLLDVQPGERVAGILHVGTPTIPPTDRPRPDVDSLLTWVE
ncbi:MAG: nitroreductase [Pseudomonadota bacterium]